MSNEVIVAVFGFAGTVVGSLLGILAANKLTTYRIQQLEKKVEKHNGVIERVFRLEDRLEKDELVYGEGLENRIKKLEKFHEKA